MSSQHKHILTQLGVSSCEEALVHLFEVTGRLVLCVHWLRGTFNWMIHTEAVKFPSLEDQANYERLFKTIEIFEQIIWELVPSRAAVVGLRDLRKSNPTITLDDLSKLLTQDASGRIPFDLSKQELEDIQDLLRRLGEARVARANGATHDKAVKRAYATIYQQGLEQ